MLTTGGSPYYEASVLGAELHAAWASIIYAIRKLRVRRIIIGGDFLTIINWMQEGPMHREAHRLLNDI